MHSLKHLNITSNWTLFLDRDGVINHEKHKDYIHTWDEFFFYDGVKEAVAVFARHFRYIFVVTNQKGVGRGLTRLQDLELIHRNMTAELEHAGGRIDAIYFCPDTDENSPNRKPNPGMGLQAIQEHPAVDLSQSIMVGNTLGDMEFGRNLGVAFNIFLPTTRPEVDQSDPRIDAVYASLAAFARALEASKL